MYLARSAHDITLKELADIQLWLTSMPVNYLKKGITTEKAVMLAQSGTHKYAIISDKTRGEYLGQLKGFLEYAYASGFIQSDMSHHIEIPNTKQTKSITRLPFTSDDLAKIFNPRSYGKAFYKKRTAIGVDVKFWLPLLAVFSNIR